MQGGIHPTCRALLNSTIPFASRPPVGKRQFVSLAFRKRPYFNGVANHGFDVARSRVKTRSTNDYWRASDSTKDFRPDRRRLPYLRLTPFPPPRFRKSPDLLEQQDEEEYQTDNDGDGSSWNGPQHAVARHWASSEQLEEELTWVAHESPHPPAVHHILKILIEYHGLRPTSVFYEALILANCSASYGSCEDVKGILGDMERENIALEAPVYAALLKVLAVHPNFHFRTAVLNQLERQWIPLSVQARNYIATSLLREGQHELAWLEIENMRQESVPVEPWLYAILMHSLCDQQDFEGVLHLIYDLMDNRVNLPAFTWLYVLQKASQHQHYEVTSWVWREMVETLYVKPGLQECCDTLRLSTSANKYWLATSVMLVLKNRYTISKENQDIFDKVFDPDMFNKALEDSTGAPRRQRYQSRNLLRVFNKENGLEKARFDPREVLARANWHR